MTPTKRMRRKDALLREQKAWLRAGRLKSIKTLSERWGRKKG